MGVKENLEELERRNRDALLGGGEERLRRQHEEGKLSARERVEQLLDPGTFVELDRFKTHRCSDFGMTERRILGDGVVTGHGTIDGRRVFLFSQDFTVFGGSLSGADTHNQRSGVAHFEGENDADTLAMVRELLSFIPSNNLEDPPFVPTDDDPNRRDSKIGSIIPDSPNKPYDMHDLIRAVIDDGYFFEVQPAFARNIVCGFARLGGRSVGIVANQPAFLAGVLDIDASVKAGRFVRFCDCFNLPIITFVDVPGFLPGTAQEFGGIIRHGAKLLYAFCEATVPKVTIITRKAYGGAYVVMSSKHIRGDVNLAYPTAEIAVMGPDGAVNIIFRDQIERAKEPERERARLVDDYRRTFANPFKAAELGYVDEIISPEETRPRLIGALEMLQNKRDRNPPKKHGNIPL